MRRSTEFLSSLLLLALLASTTAAQRETPRKRESVTYHGVEVAEEYRWLEKVDNAAVKSWIAGRNQHSEEFFRRLPNVPDLRKQIGDLDRGALPSFEKIQYAKGVVCALCDRSLVVLKSERDAMPARTLVDIDDPPVEGLANIDFYSLSPDGRFAAVSISEDGLEEGTVHVYEVATGKKLVDLVPQACAAPGGDVVWLPDCSGFYYLRYPDATPTGKLGYERYARQEIWFHKISTKASDDRYVCGRDLPPYTLFGILVSENGKHTVVGTSSGFASNETAWYLLNPTGKLEPLARPEDRILDLKFGPNDTLVLESWKDAPRGKLLTFSLAVPNLERARVLVPQGDAVLHSWLVTDRLLYLVDRRDGSERLRVFDLGGNDHPPAIEIPQNTAVEEMVRMKGDVLVYKLNSFLQPPRWLRYDPSARKSETLPLSEASAVDFRNIEVVREWANSQDGTKVPMTILRRKDCKLDGERPVYLTGYGSARYHEQPYFMPQRHVWFDRGGVWAVAHTRGEAELGDDWHLAARGATKQKSADDFIACTEHLIGRKYTRPSRLAIYGGSDGGLLVGMALTQRPELYAAAIVDCGVLDVLRSERDHFGPHCVTEYGTVTDPQQFRAMLAYSPLHRVTNGTAYPAIWLRVGANDRRVDPVHTWKMAARLHASGTKKPVLLTTIPDEGHDFASSAAEELAFLFDQMGIK